MKREREHRDGRDGVVHIYTDGACQGNHRKTGAIAGVGVWFGKNDKRNVSEKLKGPIQTNNRAELTALIRAIEVFYEGDIKHDTRTHNDQKIVLYTDSQYCKNGIEKWMANWKRNGWQTAKKKPVKNKDLGQRLDELINIHSVKLEWVKAHAGIEGNEGADTLAVQGCSK